MPASTAMDIVNVKLTGLVITALATLVSVQIPVT